MTTRSHGTGEAPGSHFFLVMCAVSVLACGVWAWMGTLDIISLATGEVIPSSQIKSLQHLEGGIVQGIRVHEGDVVQAGEDLVVLEPVRNESEVRELRARITALEIQAIRLRAEVAGSPGATPAPEVPAIIS
ncbi:MAG: biotin/lipoyl-binding protein, partial [Magnetococcales bacterium]|nr:biotin/lipoyl-binding protein [Magnetococcales bacterium]